jgi:hypothetical protein
MPKLASILADKRTVPVDLGDGEMLTVTYRPSAVTPESEDQFLNTLAEQRGGGALAKFLALTILTWDLIGDDEKPSPTTEKALRKLPIFFLSSVVKAITGDMRPDPQNAATSNGGSLAAG